MGTHTPRWIAGTVALLLVIAASGCYQPAGAGLEAASNDAFNAPTFTSEAIIIFPTDPPTLDFSTATPEPVTEVAQIPTETPTQDVFLQLAQLSTQVAQGETDPMVATLTSIAIYNAGILAQTPASAQGGAEGGFAQPTFDIFAQPTIDPFQPPLDPLYQTATAFIVNATLTANAPLTLTANALFGPTATPTLQFFFPTATFESGGIIPPAGSCVHVVSAGENLFRISLRYNTTIQALAAANGIINVNLIVVGQQLVIPNCGGAPPTYPPPIYPTYTFPYPNPSQCGQSPVPGAGEQTYTVQQFDTLFKLSMAYGVRVVDIAARNCIQNINIIFIQQPLIIPPRQF